MPQMNQTEYKQYLINLVNKWMNEGLSGEQAVERLTVKQYDFLIDKGVDLDNLILTPEQQKAVNEIKRSPRSPSPEGYKKKYPQSKKDLFDSIQNFLTENGAEIIERPKNNYRDLDFTLNGIKYKIVLSNPRT